MYTCKSTNYHNRSTSMQKNKKKKACSTGDSQAVSHPSTKPARHCLTSVFRWELVYSTWYGRRHSSYVLVTFYESKHTQQTFPYIN